MVRGTCVVLVCVFGSMANISAKSATCFPVSAEVVSLGEANARAYAARSLDRAVTARKTSVESSGRKVTKITRKDLLCAPYPNVLGADEWSCKGQARVCTTD